MLRLTCSPMGKKAKVAKRRMLDRVELFLKIKSLDERKKEINLECDSLCNIYYFIYSMKCYSYGNWVHFCDL